ncbi:Rep [uncultured virus]|uniref:Rep n=1 Tax=uncultured virus TaxID=340016 RepID=A0A2K9LS11_9VIRU|nr:Rep [uncultured virus]
MNRMSDRWCWTINNPGDYVPPWLPERGMLYQVYEMEVGEREHTPHWQGYTRFETRKRGSTVKNIFGYDGMHLEPARGDEAQNRTYCTKDGTQVHEDGVYDENAGKQGERTDLELIRDEIQGGAGLEEIAAVHPGQFIRYANGIAQMHALLGPGAPVQRAVEVRVYWGATGTGKTHRVMTEYPEAYQVEPGRDPWGRYQAQEVVVFDEFDYTKWTIQQMNRFLDKWRCPLDARYRDRYAVWRLVVICANSSPIAWWPDSGLLLIQSFRRRIQGRVYHFERQNQTLEEAHDATCDNLI